ncbi:MAG: 3'-5' exoribonuclease [Clostridia bacterium]|nr:3'-5' exoribonuclease [Clostridia bacterium]
MANNDRSLKGNNIVEQLKDYTVVDIETTGMSPNYNKILEISAIKVRGGKEVDTFSKLINPHENIPYFISNLTGITTKMALDEGEELEDVLIGFKDFLQDDIILGHNVNFDVNFLYDNFCEVLDEPLTNDFVDTLKISRKLLPKLDHHRLDDLTDYYGIKARNKHRALNDCDLTNKVYKNMCKEIKSEFGNFEDFKKLYK